MLHHGQELDVSEAHLLDIGHELIGEFAICERTIAFFATRRQDPRCTS